MGKRIKLAAGAVGVLAALLVLTWTGEAYKHDGQGHSALYAGVRNGVADRTASQPRRPQGIRARKSVLRPRREAARCLLRPGLPHSVLFAIAGTR
jgi:hypothetical protein